MSDQTPSAESDAGLIDLLRAAYEAGYDHGADDEAYAARGVGPQYSPGVESDSFEKWLRDTRPIPPGADQ